MPARTTLSNHTTATPMFFPRSFARLPQKISKERSTHVIGGTSRMQCPKVPKITDEFRMSVLFVSITLRIAISLSTGAEMVVTRSRIEAMRRNTTPTLSRLLR